MKALQLWHEIAASGDPARLPEAISEDCVFLSPIVHTPQVGRDLTVLYLTGAMNVFNDDFHYVKEVVAGNQAVLEFMCEVDGIVINGVDILTFDNAGLICEFKVMIRPLKAINLMHGKMMAMLEQLKAS